MVCWKRQTIDLYMLNKISIPAMTRLAAKPVQMMTTYSALLVKQQAVLHPKGTFLYGIIDWFVFGNIIGMKRYMLVYVN